ncbi:hypothetical protein C8J56DRAFT_7395 [Mycena floridula]|nr:hypothetical protein C8J56DRAFT_7395 [Mycena floridula]
MTSSRRSSRSSSSLSSQAPPAWRTLSISKNSAPTRLSLVFAEPEPGAPLASATSRLPMSRRDSRGSIMSNSAPEFIDPPVASTSKLEEVAETPSNGVIPIEPIADVADEAKLPPPESNNTIQFPSGESLSVPGRSSWFGSLGRAKGKEKAEEVQKLLKDDDSEKADPVVLPSVEVQPPTPPQQTPLPDPSSSQPIPSRNNNKKSWFSSTRPNRSPTSPSPLSAASSYPSSIDEEVPELSTVTPPESETSTVSAPASDDTVRARLNSLNPSTSRFTISLPLLGRPKIPLERAVVSPRQEPGTSEFSYTLTWSMLRNNGFSCYRYNHRGRETDDRDHDHPDDHRGRGLDLWYRGGHIFDRDKTSS